MGGLLRAVVVLTMVGGFASVAAPASSEGRAESFIVVLEPGATSVRAEASALARAHGGDVGFVYEHALRGFSITASPAAAAAIARSPRVAYVEADQVMSVADQSTPTGVRRIFAVDIDPNDPDNPANTKLDIDKTDDLRVDVDVAVIDTGIDLDHVDLNVVGGTNCLVSPCAGTGNDDHYHGTHVAGTVAALDNGLGVVGVAPGARLWAVKVLDARGSGSNASVIAGIDWVVARKSIEVANLSLGGGYSQALNDAVAEAREPDPNDATKPQVSVVVAAGNSAADAKSYSPSSEPAAITVSALADFNGAPGGGGAPTCRSDVDDTFADFSNYGTTVDIIAPGVCIASASPGDAYRTISGTSMASPHVAGAAALLRSAGMGAAETETALESNGNLGWSGDRDSTKEPLLDVSNDAVFAPKLVATPAPDPDPDPGSGGVVFTGSSTSQKSSWTARVTVSGASAGDSFVGTWSVGGSANSCTVPQGATGCTISRSGIAKRVASATWTRTGTTTTVTVLKP